VDKRYEAYCFVDPYFYDSTSRVVEHPREFKLSHAPVPDGWASSERDNWHVRHPIGGEFPAQGWKVHVSACLDNAEQILAVVADYCGNRRISFKFLRSLEVLLVANAKYANRGASGKFITIYPVDEAQLKDVLTELGEMLDGYQGPYVLSDLRWADGPLYVRYGGFAERHCMSETGSLELAIEDPEGRLVPDRRDPCFRYPEWVRLPTFLEPHLAARNNVKVDVLPYQIERAMHFSNGGGLYLGQHTATGTPVVLKEARPHAGLDIDGTDAVARLRREREMLERLAGLDVVPAVHGEFTLGEHHFLALEFIDAIPLRKAIAERYPLIRPHADSRPSPNTRRGLSTFKPSSKGQSTPFMTAVWSLGTCIRSTSCSGPTAGLHSSTLRSQPVSRRAGDRRSLIRALPRRKTVRVSTLTVTHWLACACFCSSH
jgi:hypothetical protein